MKCENEEESMEDLLSSQDYMLYALINVLAKKGLITKKELLDELDKIEKNAIEQIMMRN